MTDPNVHRGRVTSFAHEEGWGTIHCDGAPGEVWVHFSSIEGEGFRSLDVGDTVELTYEEAAQDGWSCRATWVRRLTRGAR